MYEESRNSICLVAGNGCTDRGESESLPQVPARPEVASYRPLQPLEWPERPWAHLHADYAGPFMGKMFLTLVDAHSKWIEVHVVSAATSQSTMEKMRSIFATHGLPEMLVTDNRPVFTSGEFEVFLDKMESGTLRVLPITQQPMGWQRMISWKKCPS